MTIVSTACLLDLQNKEKDQLTLTDSTVNTIPQKKVQSIFEKHYDR